MQQTQSPQDQPVTPQKKDNSSPLREQSSFQLSSFIKIVDPESGEVLLQQRCE
jgi:hypothetical protein